jgi:hypothetical protein
MGSVMMSLHPPHPTDLHLLLHLLLPLLHLVAPGAPSTKLLTDYYTTGKRCNSEYSLLRRPPYLPHRPAPPPPLRAAAAPRLHRTHPRAPHTLLLELLRRQLS